MSANAEETWNNHGSFGVCQFGGDYFQLIQTGDNYSIKYKKIQFDATGVLFLPESYARPYSNVEKFRLYDDKDKKWHDEQGKTLDITFKKLDVVLKGTIMNKTETIYVDVNCIPVLKKYWGAHGVGNIIQDEIQQ